MLPGKQRSTVPKATVSRPLLVLHLSKRARTFGNGFILLDANSHTARSMRLSPFPLLQEA
jgi:hypothetical protein